MNDESISAQKIEINLDELASLLGFDKDRVKLIATGTDPILNVAFLYTVSVSDGNTFVTDWIAEKSGWINAEQLDKDKENE